QHRRAGDGEAGHRLEQRLDGVGDGARQHEGHRPHHTDEHPGQGGGDAALPHIKDLAAGLDAGQRAAGQAAQHDGEQEHLQHVPLPVERADQGGQAHQGALAQQDVAQQPEYDGVIHLRAPPCPATMSRRSCRPCCRVTTMTVSPSWMVSPPRGMMIWSPRVMQHSSRLGFRCSSLRGTPVAGLTSWTVNSSASTRSSRMRYRVLMLLPASFCRARTYWTIKSQVMYLG